MLGNHATPQHVDFVCDTGLFQSLWFDLEHFDLPTQDLAVLNLVARAYPVTTVARFKATDYQTLMRVLESGVGGITKRTEGTPHDGTRQRPSGMRQPIQT